MKSFNDYSIGMQMSLRYHLTIGKILGVGVCMHISKYEPQFPPVEYFITRMWIQGKQSEMII